MKIQISYQSESKVLQYFGSVRDNSAALNAFAEVVKMTNFELSDAELDWYSLSATHQNYQGREDDELHWTERSWARLILSECYSLDLPWLRRWCSTLNCEMQCSPDTIQVILTGFAEVVKITNHTGLWNAELAWCSLSATHWICRGREENEPH